MSEQCNNQCGSCSEDCADRTQPQDDFIAKPHPMSRIKKVIGVVSGKGGVGKSLVTALLATTMRRRGHRCAVLDADITGPSIPMVFGLHSKAMGSEDGILPLKSRDGIPIMSINLLLPQETEAVIWRGPLIGNAVQQFWTDVIWGDVDYMFIDMPPGTGDVALTVFQSLPIDGIVIVASPQELVAMIVAKAIRMAQTMNIPILGLVENMSYFTCPDNNKQYKIFGESHIDDIARAHGLTVLAKLPIEPGLASACDRGAIEDYQHPWLEGAAERLERL